MATGWGILKAVFLKVTFPSYGQDLSLVGLASLPHLANAVMCWGLILETTFQNLGTTTKKIHSYCFSFHYRWQENAEVYFQWWSQCEEHSQWHTFLLHYCGRLSHLKSQRMWTFGMTFQQTPFVSSLVLFVFHNFQYLNWRNVKQQFILFSYTTLFHEEIKVHHLEHKISTQADIKVIVINKIAVCMAQLHGYVPALLRMNV